MEEAKAEQKKSSPGCCQPIVSITSSDDFEGNQADLTPENYSWISETVTTATGTVPVVKTRLVWSDRRGAYLARWGINRMAYRVRPGLYAAGSPNDKSPVFVSANYKMSFDRLRSQLKEIDAWILVLDTKGINVWCAAGKGTFGTDEIIRQIEKVRLDEVVSHRRLIVPQLGAPGIKAHEVKERSGFRIRYGPVRAADLPVFMKADLKATPEMRKVRFSFYDRLVLIPNDLVSYGKHAVLAAVILFLLSGFGPDIYSLDRVFTTGVINALLIIVVYLAGVTLPQMLLPWLPGRSFSAKGSWIGLSIAVGIVWLAQSESVSLGSTFSVAAWCCIAVATTSFVAMNFTGSSTYTSLSGVLKEMRVAVPIQIGLALIGVGLWIAGLFL